MDNILKKYRYVLEYDTTVDIPESLINSMLQRTWKVTPSKNNFMPYSVNVLGPSCYELKQKVFQKCLKHELTVDDVRLMEQLKSRTRLALYRNILSCSYLFIFTQRVEDCPNDFQQYCMSQGRVYGQTNAKHPDKARNTALIETGMFASTFAALCLENDIDVSFTLCFPTNLESWKDEEFSFIKQKPILMLSAGKGLRYRRDEFLHFQDLKPNYERIINIIK